MSRMRAQNEIPMTAPSVTETQALSVTETQDEAMNQDDWHALSLRPAQAM